MRSTPVSRWRKAAYALLVSTLVVQLSLLCHTVRGFTAGRPRIVSVDLINPRFYQGLATDGRRWIFSYRYSLYATKVDDYEKVVYKNEHAIPPKLEAEGYDHIGDLDLYDGKVYAPLEDRLYSKPLIALYSADTLEYVGSIGPLPQSHIPWCAVDPDTQTILTSEFSDVDEIYVYDMNGKLVKKIRLSSRIDRVQGGEIVGKLLYLTADDGGDTVYVVEVETGEVRELIRIGTPFEMEGVEYWNEKLYVIVAVGGYLENMLFIIDLSTDSGRQFESVLTILASMALTLVAIYAVKRSNTEAGVVGNINFSRHST